MALSEIVPPIALGDFKTVKLTKLTADVSDTEVDQALDAWFSRTGRIRCAAPGEQAAKDDRVIISFAGTIDGTPFEGGSGDDAAVLIGSNTFIPGFEESLIGVTSGETRTLKVTFPKHYMKQELAGKDAEFVVTRPSPSKRQARSLRMTPLRNRLV